MNDGKSVQVTLRKIEKGKGKESMGTKTRATDWREKESKDLENTQLGTASLQSGRSRFLFVLTF